MKKRVALMRNVLFSKRIHALGYVEYLYTVEALRVSFSPNNNIIQSLGLICPDATAPAVSALLCVVSSHTFCGRALDGRPWTHFEGGIPRAFKPFWEKSLPGYTDGADG
jgi:hypothetical protein